MYSVVEFLSKILREIRLLLRIDNHLVFLYQNDKIIILALYSFKKIRTKFSSIKLRKHTTVYKTFKRIREHSITKSHQKYLDIKYGY